MFFAKKSAAKNELNGEIFNNAFFKAAVLTMIVFIVGVSLGMWLDNLRLDDVQGVIEDINFRWNDARMQTLYYQMFDDVPGFCEATIESNLRFNDEIYKEGVVIERYENVNKFTPELENEKKRYALLQLQFWINSIQIREKCDTNYTILVYLHSKNESFAIDQKVQSAVLIDIKEKCGEDLMLIPLPGDIGISTIDIVKNNYAIDTFPSIIIDESVVLEGLQSEDELLKFIPCLQ